MRNLLATFALAIIVLPLATPASAQVLVSYPFTSDLTASVVDPSVASTTVDVTNLNGASIGDDGHGSVLEAYPNDGSTSSATALTNDSFWTLSLAAAGGGDLDLGNLSFEVGKGGSSSPRGYFVRSSVDGFASDLLSETLPLSGQPAPELRTINLSSASFQDLPSITFRFYIFTPDPGGNSVDFRNVTVEANSGSAAAPEPGTFALLGAGIGVMGLVARRKQ